MKLLDRYILRSHVGPFFFGLAVITFILIMDLIYRYLDLFISKGVPVQIVLEVFALSLGHMFALSIPMAVLVATLMAFGNLTGENEIVAMKANGVSLFRMLGWPLIAATMVAGGLTAFNNFVLPESNHRLLSLLISIRQKNPSIEIKPNVFIKDFKPYTIYIGKKDDKTGLLEDLRIYKEEQGKITTVTAERGYFTYQPDRNLLRFDLQDGQIHELPDTRDGAAYRKTSFRNYTINIPDVDRELLRKEHTYRGDREMDVPMMVAKIRESRADKRRSEERILTLARNQLHKKFELLDRDARERRLGDRGGSAAEREPSPRPDVARQQGDVMPVVNLARTIENELQTTASYERVINRYLVEIHKKFSIPVACIVFVLLGAPLAVRSRRGGMTVAIGLSIFFFLIYYLFLIGGEKMADRGRVPAWVAMWSPNIVLGALGLYLLRRSVREMTFIPWHRLKFLGRRSGTNAHANS
jgi:lipopolysaccharide export system permease protein